MDNIHIASNTPIEANKPAIRWESSPLTTLFPTLLKSATPDQLTTIQKLIIVYCDKFVKRILPLSDVLHWCNSPMYYLNYSDGRQVNVTFAEVIKSPLVFKRVFNNCLPKIDFAQGYCIITDNAYDKNGIILFGHFIFLKSVLEKRETLSNVYLPFHIIYNIITSNIDKIFGESLDYLNTLPSAAIHIIEKPINIVGEEEDLSDIPTKKRKIDLEEGGEYF